jgi:hypothetical protein
MANITDSLSIFGKYDDPVTLMKCLSNQVSANRLYRLDNQFCSLSILSIMRLASVAPYHLIAAQLFLEDLNGKHRYQLCDWNPNEDVVGQCERVVAAVQAQVPVQTHFKHLLYRAGKVYLLGE